MIHEMEAVVLAGGHGSRMGELTRETQKCLLPIEGKPAILHILEGLVGAYGSVDVKVGVAYKQEQVKDMIDKYKPGKATVTYVPHVPGTEGWGIYRGMRDYIRGEFVATPGDIIAFPEVFTGASELLATSRHVAALTLSPDTTAIDTHGLGRIENSEVVELEWGEKRLVPEAPGYLRDMTIWASNPDIFNVIDRFPSPKQSIGVLFEKALKAGMLLAGQEYHDYWIHLGYPEDLNKTLSDKRGGVRV